MIELSYRVTWWERFVISPEGHDHSWRLEAAVMVEAHVDGHTFQAMGPADELPPAVRAWLTEQGAYSTPLDGSREAAWERREVLNLMQPPAEVMASCVGFVPLEENAVTESVRRCQARARRALWEL